jgi:hypothetical protein
VYNLLRSTDRSELYPGDREDSIDFSVPGHESRLGEGWHELEGSFGNKYRWIGTRASAKLVRVNPGPQRIRIRGFAPESVFAAGRPTIHVNVNARRAGSWSLDRVGLFVLEAAVEDAKEYRVDVEASPVWHAPGDRRALTVNISALRLVPVE